MSMLEQLGGFDEALGAGGLLKSAEDLDILYRTLLLGERVEIRADLSIMHFGYRDYSSGAASRAFQDAMFGIAAYYGKHIRCGDTLAARAYAREMQQGLVAVLRNLWMRRTPLGLSWPAMLVKGFVQSLRVRVDHGHRLYLLDEAPGRAVRAPALEESAR